MFTVTAKTLKHAKEAAYWVRHCSCDYVRGIICQNMRMWQMKWTQMSFMYNMSKLWESLISAIWTLSLNFSVKRIFCVASRWACSQMGDTESHKYFCFINGQFPTLSLLWIPLRRKQVLALHFIGKKGLWKGLPAKGWVLLLTLGSGQM